MWSIEIDLPFIEAIIVVVVVVVIVVIDVVLVFVVVFLFVIADHIILGFGLKYDH